MAQIRLSVVQDASRFTSKDRCHSPCCSINQMTDYPFSPHRSKNLQCRQRQNIPTLAAKYLGCLVIISRRGNKMRRLFSVIMGRP